MGLLFNHFPINYYVKVKAPGVGAIHDPRDFIWTNLNLLAPRMFHATYQYILASSWWEEDFWRFIKIFLILPLIGHQKGPAPLFEQIWIPILQACFMPRLVEIDLMAKERYILSLIYTNTYVKNCMEFDIGSK